MGSAISSGTYAKPVKDMYSASIPIIGLRAATCLSITRVERKYAPVHVSSAFRSASLPVC